ncbi:hypothetical protein L596_025742 [Steinernema carpocapsae]|uniref:Uncharacterized protein n=1 Tax=Steinernema carpocapsae TaxID=34508 RepID=A0A4U5M9M5_STECR|nr:hypothetical protein L596_025742 [Steinernema carpocapsae]
MKIVNDQLKAQNKEYAEKEQIHSEKTSEEADHTSIEVLEELSKLKQKLTEQCKHTLTQIQANTKKKQIIAKHEEENRALKNENDQKLAELEAEIESKNKNIWQQGFAHARTNERLDWLESENRILEGKVRNLEKAFGDQGPDLTALKLQNRKRSIQRKDLKVEVVLTKSCPTVLHKNQ